MKKCRDWSCSKCGSGWLEEVGEHKADTGNSKLYCPDCKEQTLFEYYVREVSDPDEDLNPASTFCWYCKQLMPDDEMNQEYENYSHPICSYCILDGRTAYNIRQMVIVDGKAGVITDYDEEDNTYRVALGDEDFGWFGEKEIRTTTNADADAEAQDSTMGVAKI